MLIKGGNADDDEGVAAEGATDDEDEDEDLPSWERPCISDALVSESRVMMFGLLILLEFRDEVGSKSMS